jgi:hypothetical protein
MKKLRARSMGRRGQSKHKGYYSLLVAQCSMLLMKGVAA